METTEHNKLVKAHDLSFQPFISAEKIQQRVTELGQELTKEYKDKTPLLIAVLNGSFVFAADLGRACDFACDFTFIKLSSYDGLGSSGNVSTLIGLNEEIKDRHLIIVEDIVDTGNTMEHFLKMLDDREPASVAVVTLLLKPEAFNNRFDVEYVGFEIPNKFVVGYGLDYNGHARNFPAIYQLYETE